MKDLTFGIYQVKLAPSYVQDKLQREGEEEFQLEMLRDQNRLPQPGFMRVRVFSRFHNATKHQLWIAYIPTDEENEQVEAEEDENNNHIQGLITIICSCKSGARTVGTCAHIASVIWFLGYAQHQENVDYPSRRLIEFVQDAGNRPRY